MRDIISYHFFTSINSQIPNNYLFLVFSYVFLINNRVKQINMLEENIDCPTYPIAEHIPLNGSQRPPLQLYQSIKNPFINKIATKNKTIITITGLFFIIKLLLVHSVLISWIDFFIILIVRL